MTLQRKCGVLCNEFYCFTAMCSSITAADAATVVSLIINGIVRSRQEGRARVIFKFFFKPSLPWIERKRKKNEKEAETKVNLTVEIGEE